MINNSIPIAQLEPSEANELALRIWFDGFVKDGFPPDYVNVNMQLKMTEH
jgi:hypothetical protein